jgi:hypothetical protein
VCEDECGFPFYTGVEDYDCHHFDKYLVEFLKYSSEIKKQFPNIYFVIIESLMYLEKFSDEVWGGPNGDYSLTEARKNFKENLIMYRDKRNILSQTEKEMETKKSLIDVFIELSKCQPDSSEYKALWNKIRSYEKILVEASY